MQIFRKKSRHIFTLLLLLAGLLAACERPDPQVTLAPSAIPPGLPEGSPAAATAAPNNPTLPPTPTLVAPTPALPDYAGTPTPDPTRPSTTEAQANSLPHIVQAGESLSYIAQLYGSTIEELESLNGLPADTLLEINQVVLVPGDANSSGPDFKLIPDSELVYGPSAQGFDIQAAAAVYGGYLLAYQEDVEGRQLNGPAVVELVAQRFSVNPRLLLALLEYRTGWLTQPGGYPVDYPLGFERAGYEGLYQQLSWLANQLNFGYYGRAEGGLTGLTIGESTQQVNFAPGINDGTAGVQVALAALPTTTPAEWQYDVSENGFFATYSRLFGNPFAYTYDPLWPADLAQPALRLPWPAEDAWYFTGGPHGGWASGSAWAALDFVPVEAPPGCVVSDNWVTAMAAGLVVRSDFGAVVVDLDGDGYAGTGWTILYMHLESRERIAAGLFVEAGDPLGHPSCEGGYANSTHVHIARLYNGRWVAADGPLPLTMDGWVAQGLGYEYDGLLVRGDVVKEACECREEGNTITVE